MLVCVLILTGCASTNTAGGPPAPTGNCARAPRIPGSAGSPPVAVLHDIAAGQEEYLMGVPGKSYVRIVEPGLVASPVIAGGGVFFSERNGTKYQSRVAAFGQCSTLVSAGYLGPVDPEGRAAVVYDAVAGHTRLVARSGHVLAELSQNTGNWTNDGRLVVHEATGIAVYDLTGRRRSLNVGQSISPAGAQGPHGEIVTTATGAALIDLDTGHLTHLAGVSQAVSASPDGSYLVVMDLTKGWGLKRLKDGVTTQLTTFGPPVATSWSRDGEWLSIETLYGGEVIRLSDGRVTDLGPLLASF